MSRIPVIFDTDPGIDDALALFMLAHHPALELRAITTVFGNAPLHTTTHNALGLCHTFGLDVPVAAGAAAPLQPGLARGFPVQVHGDDGLGGQAGLLGTTRQALHKLAAADFICEQVLAAPGELSLLAVGPLTNLALALRQAPEIAGKVKQVVVMGGAFGSHGHGGNVTPVAEANIMSDPEAADMVLSAAWPVTIVGLDVTQQVVMHEAQLEALRGRGGRVGDLFWALTRQYQHFYQSRDGIQGIYAHDSTAVAYLAAPEAFTLRAGPVRVVLEGIARGQTIQDFRALATGATPWGSCPAQQVCVEVDAERVRGEFMRAFAGLGG